MEVEVEVEMEVVEKGRASREGGGAERSEKERTREN